MLALKDNGLTRLHKEEREKETTKTTMELLARKYRKLDERRHWTESPLQVAFRSKRKHLKAPLINIPFHSIEVDVNHKSWAEVTWEKNDHKFSRDKMMNIIVNTGSVITKHKEYKDLVRDTDFGKMKPWEVFQFICNYLTKYVTKNSFAFGSYGETIEYRLYRESEANFEFFDIKAVLNSKRPAELKTAFIEMIRMLTAKWDVLLWDDLLDMRKDYYETIEEDEKADKESEWTNPMEEYNDSPAEEWWRKLRKKPDMKIINKFIEKYSQSKSIFGPMKHFAEILYYAKKVYQNKYNIENFQFFDEIPGVQEEEVLPIADCYRFVWDGNLRLFEDEYNDMNDRIGNYGQMAWVLNRHIDINTINESFDLESDYPTIFHRWKDKMCSFYNSYIWKEKNDERS